MTCTATCVIYGRKYQCGRPDTGYPHTLHERRWEDRGVTITIAWKA